MSPTVWSIEVEVRTVLSVHARRLKDLVQLPVGERLDTIADGLRLLAEQAQTLREDLTILGDADRPRGFSALSVTANEEAAKALILLDLVRAGWSDPSLVQRQISRFYDHLARSIYAEMTEMSPADFAEIRRLVDLHRPSHYLDGPDYGEYIFRNQALTQREEALYVDLIRDEDGLRWVSPSAWDSAVFGYLTTPLDLVISLDRLGCTRRRALDAIASVWSGQVVDDSTHWQEVRALNVEIVEEVSRLGLVSPETESEDARRVIERWTFPLTGLDLEVIEVTPAELQARRERRFADWEGY